MRLLVVITLLFFSLAARADVDCAQCRALCKSGGGKTYPDELGAENAPVRHKTKDAEAAFLDAKTKDPAFGGRDVGGAIRDYKKAVLLDGDNASYRNHLAAALLAAGAFDEAIYNLNQAVKLVPSEPKFLVNLGYAHHRAGDEVRASIYYMRALMLDPRDVRARLFLGYALEMLGYTDEAAVEMKKVLNQDAHNEGARRALVRLGALPPPPPPGSEPPPPLDPSDRR